MKLFKSNSPILKAASIQIALVGALSLVLIIAFSFISTSESLKKVRSIYEPLKGEINSEVFINNTTNAKNDNQLYSIKNFKTQIQSNDVQANILVGSCGSKADIEFAISSIDEMNKCVLVQLKDHSIVSYVKNIALAIILLIILSLPIYHFAFKESVKSESFKARSDLADEVVHGVGSPLARFELALGSIKGTEQNENVEVLKSVYEDFKYQFLKLSYVEVRENEKIKTDLKALVECSVPADGYHFWT